MLSPFPGELIQAIRPYGDEGSAWYFLAIGSIFSGLSGAGADLFWSAQTPEKVREQRSYEVRQEIKTFAVVAGGVAIVFGFFTAYLVLWYVLAPVLRYFL